MGNGPEGKLLQVGLMLAGKRSLPLETTKEMCEESSDVEVDILTMPTDVTRETDVQNLMNAINTYLGRFDILFNNVGINIASSSIEKIDSDNFQKVLDMNVTV